jgi:hypothetical protein
VTILLFPLSVIVRLFIYSTQEEEVPDEYRMMMIDYQYEKERFTDENSLLNYDYGWKEGATGDGYYPFVFVVVIVIASTLLNPIYCSHIIYANRYQFQIIIKIVSCNLLNTFTFFSKTY